MKVIRQHALMPIGTLAVVFALTAMARSDDPPGPATTGGSSVRTVGDRDKRRDCSVASRCCCGAIRGRFCGGGKA